MPWGHPLGTPPGDTSWGHVGLGHLVSPGRDGGGRAGSGEQEWQWFREGSAAGRGPGDRARQTHPAAGSLGCQPGGRVTGHRLATSVPGKEQERRASPALGKANKAKEKDTCAGQAV